MEQAMTGPSFLYIIDILSCYICISLYYLIARERLNRFNKRTRAFIVRLAHKKDPA